MGMQEEQELAQELKIPLVQVKILMDIFKRHLANGAELSKQAFVDAFAEVQEQSYNPVFSPDTALAIFNVLDVDHSNSVSDKEFVCGIIVLSEGSLEEKAELAFTAFDKDGDGYLSKKELVSQIKVAYDISLRLSKLAYSNGWGAIGKIYGSLTHESFSNFKERELNKIFEADTDGDSKISLDEWVTAARSN
eukprot:CAMPEP_0174266214 /NCGR_PEP_ID=MMETSP0439-20130205/29409_1 /TAXON_ID=0 /ORGANISM="Stereomyxa ramosa, Strain Chinc5" /LENGTH=191 /DNA_ID=CAMNT_0015353049 /DNA_START=27 /DNA_END=599 /DNA_ORIENTATION=+